MIHMCREVMQLKVGLYRRERATSDADRLIAERLSALVDEHRKQGKKAAKKVKKQTERP